MRFTSLARDTYNMTNHTHNSTRKHTHTHTHRVPPPDFHSAPRDGLMTATSVFDSARRLREVNTKGRGNTDSAKPKGRGERRYVRGNRYNERQGREAGREEGEAEGRTIPIGGISTSASQPRETLMYTAGGGTEKSPLQGGYACVRECASVRVCEGERKWCVRGGRGSL